MSWITQIIFNKEVFKHKFIAKKQSETVPDSNIIEGQTFFDMLYLIGTLFSSDGKKSKDGRPFGTTNPSK